MNNLLKYWLLLSKFPFGDRIYSFLLGLIVPYSGSTRPIVRELEVGRAIVELRDRRFVRNHLNSVHAIALANVAELASGLAMLAALPKNARGIVTKIEIEYLKKATRNFVCGRKSRIT